MSYANGLPRPSTQTAPLDDEEWVVTAREKARSDDAFYNLDKDAKGYITEKEGARFFASSKLSDTVLQAIWELADIDGDGCINPDEFAVALYLIREQRSAPGGRGSPATLPSSLPRKYIPPNMRPPLEELNRRESGIGMDWDWDAIDIVPRPIRSPPTPTVRRDDGFEKQMALCFPDLMSHCPKPFSERDCSRISELLQTLGKTEWSRVPRTYAVLKMVNQVHAMDAFLGLGCNDMFFPYTEASLPEALGSRHARTKFLELQSLVLSTGHDLENILDKKHRIVANSEDLPFRVLEELGQGGFGSVDKIQSTLSFNVYARKRILRKRNFKGNKKVLADFERELATLQRISHRHIIELVGSYTDPRFVCLIMSPVCDSDLENYLTMQRLSRAQKSHLRTFYGCLAAALLYLHDNRIRHKDVKPRNILVHRNQVLLTDFGLSRDSTEHSRSTTTGRPSALSMRYAAPEVASWDARSYSADIYSLGAVFLEMTTVLLERSLKDFRTFMTTHGSRDSPFWMNEDGFTEWIDVLQRSAQDESDTLPLTWIPRMMEKKRDNRPTARGLFMDISEPSVEVKYLFCGLCCADDDSTESARSSTGSIEATVTTDTGDETTVETRSDAKRPSPSGSRTELTMDDDEEEEEEPEPEPEPKPKPKPESELKAEPEPEREPSPQQTPVQRSPAIKIEDLIDMGAQNKEDEDTKTVTPAPAPAPAPAGTPTIVTEAPAGLNEKYRLGEIIPRDPNHPAATSEQYERHYHRYLELRNDPTTNIQMAFNAYLVHLERQLQWDKVSSSIASIAVPPGLLPEPRPASAEPDRSSTLQAPDQTLNKHKRSVSDSRRNGVLVPAAQNWATVLQPPIYEIGGEQVYPENRMVRTMKINSPEDWEVSWPEDAYQKLAASPYIPAVDILILAIRRRHVSQIAWLLESSPDPEVCDVRGWSPIHYAAAFGDVKIMSMLVKAGFQHWVNKDGVQPIHLAVRNSHLAAVLYLVGLGANIDAKDNNGVRARSLVKEDMDTAFYGILPECEIDSQEISFDQYLANTRPNTDLKQLYVWNLDRNLILIHACRTGNITEVMSLLTSEWDVNTSFTDPAGYSALHFAASFGHDQVCQLLISAGFDAQAQSASGGFRPIHYANLYYDKLLLQEATDGKELTWQENVRMQGFRNTIKVLQAHNFTPSSSAPKAKKDAVKPAGTAANNIINGIVSKLADQNLRNAATDGAVIRVKKYLDDGANINGINMFRETALHRAADGGHIEVVKVLVEAGAALALVDMQGRSALYRAVLNDHNAVVTYLALHHAPLITGNQKKEPAIQQNPNRDSEVLAFAARSGNAAVVKEQLSKGVEINKKMSNENTALHEAVLGHNEEIVRMLVKEGADLRITNGSGKLALDLARESDQQSMLLLLQNAARDSMALESAVRKGIYMRTMELLNAGVSALGIDDEGLSLLHHASVLGYTAIAAALIQNGAALEARTTEFQLTPLHYAAKKRHLTMIELLLEEGADINALSSTQQTPLMMSVIADDPAGVESLISAEPDYSLADDKQSTALFHAIIGNNRAIIKMLFNAGCNLYPPMEHDELASHLKTLFPGVLDPAKDSTNVVQATGLEGVMKSFNAYVRNKRSK